MCSIFQEVDFFGCKGTFQSRRKSFAEMERACRVLKAHKNYFLLIEDLRNEHLEEMHRNRLKFFGDFRLNTAAIMSHISILENRYGGATSVKVLNRKENYR